MGSPFDFFTPLTFEIDRGLVNKITWSQTFMDGDCTEQNHFLLAQLNSSPPQTHDTNFVTLTVLALKARG